MNRGLTISCIGHGTALVCGLLAISGQPLASPPVTSMPISFVSEKDFTQITQGVKNAPKVPDVHVSPLADVVDTPKFVEQLAPKVANKPEITTDSSVASPAPKPDPKPDPKPPDKPEKAKAEPKPEPKLADKPDKSKPPDYKPDQIASLLKKDDTKKLPKADDNPEKPARDVPKFNADQVAALLDKREPQRQVAAAATINSAASLGASTGAPNAQLSQSEIDALRSRISQCWNPPAGVNAASRLYVVLRTLFKPDGSLSQAPVVVEGSPSAMGPALAESAKRALLLCQPFTMLKPEHYDQWKDLELKFDPQELLGG